MTVIERAPMYCPVHQHHKWCEHNGGVMGPNGWTDGSREVASLRQQLEGAVEQNEHLLHGICDALKHLPPSTESAGTAILHSLLRGTSHDHGGGQ